VVYLLRQPQGTRSPENLVTAGPVCNTDGEYGNKMAVPRKRKKKRGKKERQQSLTELNLPPKAPIFSYHSKEHNLAEVKTEKSEREKKRSLRQMLYDDDAEGLFRLVQFLPLFLGAWLAGGLVLDEVFVFLILTAAVVLAYYEGTFARQEVIFVKDLRLVCYLAQAGLLYLFYQSTNLLPATIMAGAAVILVQAYNHLSLKEPSSVLCGCVALVLQMSFFAILGIQSQLYKLSPEVIWEHGIIGFVPGLILASVFVAKHARLFEKAGWKRSLLKTRNGKTINRPGALSTLFSLMLVIGPAIPVASAPLYIFPWPFLSCALAFFFIPQLAQAFFERRMEDKTVALHCTNLAAAMSVVVFLSGVLAKFFT
jgi:hypothetical protein